MIDSRLRRAAVAAAALTFALSGCGAVQFESARTIPTLSGSALIRDDIVRTEQAIARQARAMEAKATQCEECRTVLGQVWSDSKTRIEALGGVWEPWGDEVPEGAQVPAPVVSAPRDPGELAAWMQVTARRDMDTAARTTDLPGEDARLIASAAAGRAIAAQRLASLYGVDLPAATAAVTEMDDTARRLKQEGFPIESPVSLASPDAPAGVTAVGLTPADSIDEDAAAGAADGAQSDEASGQKENPDLTDGSLTEAVRIWDCGAQTLARQSALSADEDQTAGRREQLLRRVTQAIGEGVTDARAPRCQLEADDAAAVNLAIATADLDLFRSDSPALRMTGAEALAEDAPEVSVELGSSESALPGTSPDAVATLREAAQTDSSQSAD